MYLIDDSIDEIIRVKKLNKAELVIFLVLLLSQLIIGERGFLSVILLSLFSAFIFKYKQQTTLELRYTFWGLIFFQFLIVFQSFLQSETSLTNFLSMLFIISLSIESYIMFSPIFFPRIKWWEYDFRFRGDTKVTLRINEDRYDARLSDLRRNAGAVTLFEDINYNEEIFIDIKFMNEDLSFKGKIISKRESNLGRGIMYGVRFLFNDLSERQRFSRYKKFWSMNNKIKLRNKFKGK